MKNFLKETILFPDSDLEQVKIYYQNDKRTFSEIGKEIIGQYEKTRKFEEKMPEKEKTEKNVRVLKKTPNSSLGFTNLTLLIILIIIIIFSLILVNFLK